MPRQSPPTATDSSGPLSFEPGDDTGICLDVDGTTHRTGSVFIETLIFLPYADAIDWDRSERRQFREVVGRVAEYADGPDARDRWRRLFRLLDELDAAGAGWLASSLLGAALRYRRWRESRRSSATAQADDEGAEEYREMRHAVLEAYGDLIRGKSRDDLEAAVAEIVSRRFEIDPTLRETLERAARAGTDVYLVTDMPEHVARAYARRLTGMPDAVVATSFVLDGEGRFTGEVEHVDKGEAVARLRETRRWEYLIAAGDSAVDLGMADVADLFLAVEGQGDVTAHLDEEATVEFAADTTPSALRNAFRDGADVLEIGREQELATALSTTLSAVGLLDTRSDD